CEDEQEAIRHDQPASKQDQEQSGLDRVERPPHLVQRQAHHRRAHEEIGGGGPIDVPATEEKLLVDRLEQEVIKVSAADQVRELVAVFQKQRLDRTLQGEVAAHEEQVFGLRPARDDRSASEDSAVEEQQQRQPEDFDREFRQEVRSKGELP